MTTRTALAIEFTQFEAATRGSRDQLLAAIAAVKDLVAPALAAPGSVAVPAHGGTRIVVVDGAARALELARDLLAAAAAAGHPARCALETGDLLLGPGPVAGPALDVARGLLELVPEGEAWFGPVTRGAAYGAAVAWDDAGAWHLRGLAGRLRVARLVPDGACFLPAEVEQAAARGTLVVVRPGVREPFPDPNGVVVLLGRDAPIPEGVTAARTFLLATTLDPAARWEWAEQGRGVVIGTEEAFRRAVGAVAGQRAARSGSDSIVLDVGASPVAELRVAGVAVLRCPVEVIERYRLWLVADGRWLGSPPLTALLELDVGPEGAALVARAPGVTADGRTLPVDARVVLDGPHAVSAGGHELRYVPLPEGSPWWGALWHDTDFVSWLTTGPVQLGREPSHPGLAMPDRRGAENVTFVSGPRGAKAKAHGATLDRLTVPRTMADVEVADESSFVVHGRNERSPVWVGDGPESAPESVPADTSRALQLGGVLWVGPTVVRLEAPRG